MINAINDALAPLGVTLTRLPASPAAIVDLIEQASCRRTWKGPLNVELNNEFRVAVPAAKTWQVLTDVERVAPCIPGAQLLSVDGDDFTGAVKVKVGPITVSYKGEASFQEKDEAAQRVVIKASGKETRGSGNAAALVTAQLKDEGDATHVVITTDLTISGKAAQFGRGVLADVSTNLIGQFARNLEAELLGGSAPSGAAPSAAHCLAGRSRDRCRRFGRSAESRCGADGQAVRAGDRCCRRRRGGRLSAGEAQARAPRRGPGR